jgi:hypothetical protein
MSDPSDSAAGRAAREQTLARLMEATAVLAAARIGPGDPNEAVKTAYQCSVSIVMHEYWRMLGYGFTDDPVKAALAYSTGMEGTAGFTPS